MIDSHDFAQLLIKTLREDGFDDAEIIDELLYIFESMAQHIEDLDNELTFYKGLLFSREVANGE